MADSRCLNIMNQRTSSMTSFVDAHTPSESPEASSSESSTGGDWESGEFKTNELVVEHWPKQRKFSNSKLKNKKLATFKTNNTNTANTAITTSTSSIPAKLSHQHQFKAKSNSIKIFNNTSNLSSNNGSVNVNINNNVHLSKLNTKKLRWLWNMRSDPDFHETIVKTVNIQTPSELVSGRQSSDSLDMDYYSAICDNQLSVGSPYKSPSDRVPTMLSDQMKSRSRTNSFTKRYQHNSRLYVPQMQANRRFTPLEQDQIDSIESSTFGTETVLVVAKPIESQSIGFNVVDTTTITSTSTTVITTTTPTTICSSESVNAAAGKQSNQFRPSTSGIQTTSDAADNAKKRFENDHKHDKLLEKSPKRPKSNDFDDIPVVNASSGSSVTIANEQNSIFSGFSFSPNKHKKHSKIIIGSDSTDNSSSNSPTEESPDVNPSLSKIMFFKGKFIGKSKSNLPPMRSASTSSATDCDEVDSKPSWSGNAQLLTNVKQSTTDISGSNDLTARSSTSSNSTTSSSSSSLTNIKRNRPPFSFRDIRNELRSVMRQNRNISK